MKNPYNFLTLPSWILGIFSALSFHINYPLFDDFVDFLDFINFRFKLIRIFFKLTNSSRTTVFTSLYVSTWFWSDKVTQMIYLFDSLSNVLVGYSVTIERFFADQSYSRLESWYNFLKIRHVLSLMWLLLLIAIAHT